MHSFNYTVTIFFIRLLINVWPNTIRQVYDVLMIDSSFQKYISEEKYKAKCSLYIYFVLLCIDNYQSIICINKRLNRVKDDISFRISDSLLRS